MATSPPSSRSPEVEAPDGRSAAAKAVELVRQGKAELLMKGSLHTDELLGAVVARDGYVAEAEGGTLFLDEVAELTPLAQARLLRFLQESEYRRLGVTTLRRANVRVLSATNVDLALRVRQGCFREDLWFRLKHERLVVPPLRERGGAILILARHFLELVAGARGVGVPRLTSPI